MRCNMEKLIEQISAVGVVPVVKLDSADDALPLAAALKKGGICCAEVTFRTDAAEEAISLIAKEFPDFLVAAGTVLTPKQADAAMQAGGFCIHSAGGRRHVRRADHVSRRPVCRNALGRRKQSERDSAAGCAAEQCNVRLMPFYR